MKTSLLLVALTVVVVAPRALADDIKLKSGEEFKDVTVTKTMDDKIRFRLPSGRSKTVKIADIAAHVKKTSSHETFDVRRKKLGRKDVKGMLELARFGQECGLSSDVAKLLVKVVKLDKNNAEARAILGDEKGQDGRWRRGKTLARYKVQKAGEKMAALGWVQIKKKWHDPHSARNLNANLVQHTDGLWYSMDEMKNLKKGLVYAKGDWFTVEEKAKLGTMVREEGTWVAIADIDRGHRNSDNPWVLKTRHFEFTAPVSHRNTTNAVNAAESMWSHLVEFFGDGPVALNDDRLRVLIVKGSDGYNNWGTDGIPGRADRAAWMQNNAAYTYVSDNKLGTTYYHSEVHLRQWSQAVAAHCFMGALIDWETAPDVMWAAIGAYFEGFTDGRYYPSTMIALHIMSDQHKSARAVFGDFSTGGAHDSRKREAELARLGFAVHHLRRNAPDALATWMVKFRSGDADWMKLIENAEAEMKAKGIDRYEQWAKERAEFKKTWVNPKK